MAQRRTLSQQIGHNLGRIREEEGRTQDEIAGDLREVGLPWRRSTVAEVEAGERGLSIEEAVLLAAALRKQLGAMLGGGTVVLSETDETTTETDAVTGFVTGEMGPERFLKVLDVRYKREKRREMAELLSYRNVWPRATLAQLRAAVAAATGEAEAKAARKLGTDALTLSVVAFQRWGRSLTDERDRRVAGRAEADISDRSRQALRGHVTRELLQELEPSIRQHAGRRRKR